PEESALLAERRQAVQACRRRLASRDQELLDLRYGLDLKYQAIAKRLKMTISHVGVALSRAEERVRRCLRDHYPDLFTDWSEGSPAEV
ncbi:MAG TPA: sigma-70 family RNA polymerase sigma factor, partial [Candidatus Methylomirabilis sp.]|nr:sigma-70 family RNA polymerase sigma factor [Candidatus Methylomirabilis sp.]